MKRAFIIGFLILFAAWPAVHAGLTSRYGIDPWKLAGFAMYCVPGAMKTVRVVRISSDGSFSPLDFRDYTPAQQRIVDDLRERRRSLGSLHSADTAAADLLVLHPDWEGVLIAILSLTLDTETARLTDERTTHTYWRDDRDEPFDLPTP